MCMHVCVHARVCINSTAPTHPHFESALLECGVFALFNNYLQQSSTPRSAVKPKSLSGDLKKLKVIRLNQCNNDGIHCDMVDLWITTATIRAPSDV